MIHINISPEGDINITQEGVDERIAMHKTYEDEQGVLKRLWIAEHGEKGERIPEDVEPDKGCPVDHEAEGDGQAHDQPMKEPDEARIYRKGFSHAVQIAFIAQLNGEMDKFFESNLEGYEAPTSQLPDAPVLTAPPQTVGEDAQGRYIVHNHADGSLTPRDEDPIRDAADETRRRIRSRLSHNHGVPIAATDATPEQIVEKGAETVVKAADPGEPVPHGGEPIEGVYTISAAELESIRDEEYRRGRADGVEAGVNVNKTVGWAGVQNAIKALFQQKAADQFGDPSNIPAGSELRVTHEEIIRHILKSVGYTIVDEDQEKRRAATTVSPSDSLVLDEPQGEPLPLGADPGDGADGWG